MKPQRLSPATELDHIVALVNGGSNQDNYQGLCSSCHKRKTDADLGRTTRPTIGVDGYPIDDD